MPRRRPRAWALLVLLAACGSDPANSSPPQASDCPPDSILTWQSFAEPFLLNHCTGCHSSQLPEGARAEAPLGVDFDTHEKTRSWLERIASRSAGMNATMPPTDTVADEDRDRLAEWIACGAP